MKPVPHGEPYAGNLHVRFDEGAGVPDNKGRSALLYTPRNVRFSGFPASCAWLRPLRAAVSGRALKQARLCWITLATK
jgi:hypothetical protein